MALTDRRPGGLLNAAFRAPIVIYRMGLGRLLGHRFVYVVHTGRRSGRMRENVLEVVRYDRSVPEVFVVAAWGERSDWYRNIIAAGAVEIRTGAQRWRRPRHRVLDSGETVRLIESYRARYPRTWRRLAPMIGFDPTAGDQAFRAAVERIRALAFSPRATASE